MLLNADQLDNNIKKALAAVFCANITAKDRINLVVDKIAKSNKNIVDVEDYTDSNKLTTHGQYNNQHNLNSVLKQSFPSTKIDSKIQKFLENLLQKVHQYNKKVKNLMAAKK